MSINHWMINQAYTSEYWKNNIMETKQHSSYWIVFTVDISILYQLFAINNTCVTHKIYYIYYILLNIRKIFIFRFSGREFLLFVFRTQSSCNRCYRTFSTVEMFLHASLIELGMDIQNKQKLLEFENDPPTPEFNADCCRKSYLYL